MEVNWNFASKLSQKLKKGPLFAMVSGGVIVFFVLGWWNGSTGLQERLSPKPRAPKTQDVSEIDAAKAQKVRDLKTVSEENAALKDRVDTQDAELRKVSVAFDRAKQDAATAARQQQDKFDEWLRRAQEVSKRPSTPAPPVRQAALPVSKPPTSPPVRQFPAPSQHEDVKVRIIVSDHKEDMRGGPPPSALSPDTPYLPLGSFALTRIVTGAMATSRAGGALPVLMVVAQQFVGPQQLVGFGHNPLPTALPMHGCLAMGLAQADLGSSRVLIELKHLSCVMPDGSSFTREIKGYVTGLDGTLGIVGRVETHDSAAIAKVFLTSLLAGAGEAFALARRTVVVTPFGGTQSTITGNVGETAGFSALATAAAQLSQFYLQQASQLLPTLWLESKTPGYMVLTEGLALEGLSLTAAMRGH